MKRDRVVMSHSNGVEGCVDRSRAGVNLEAAGRRRENVEGVNPCGEILLPNKGLCNLFEVNVAHPGVRELLSLD